jgi:Domain of unknown function (DUF4157)
VLTGPEPTRRLLGEIGRGRARVGGSEELPEEAAAAHVAGHPQVIPHWAALSATSGVVAETHGPGRPLEEPTMSVMEARMGTDLSGVRVHDDEAAAASAEALGAEAFTGGTHVVFGRGSYAPDHPAGEALLEHELAHVVGGHAASDVLRRSNGDDPPRGGGRGDGLTKAEWAKLMQLRKKLGLPPRPTEGQTKIVGILIDKDGNEYPVDSGEEPHGLGTHKGGIPRGPGEVFSGGGASEKNIVTHIEGHAAAIMHQRGIKEATLLSEEKPCRVCDITQDWNSVEGAWEGNPKASRGTPAVSVGLPPDSKLTVISPGETNVFHSAPGAFVPQRGSGGATGSTASKKGSTAKGSTAKGSTAKGTSAKAVASETITAKAAAKGTTTPEATRTKPAAKGSVTPEITTAKSASPEPEGRVARGSGKPVVEVNLSDYPADGEGIILGRFNDGAAIREITTGVTMMASVISMAADKDISFLGLVEWHFNKAIGAASEELASKFPPSAVFWDQAGMDRLAKDYDAAASRVNAPRNLLAAEAFLMAFTPDSLHEAAETDAREAVQRSAQAGDGPGNWQNYIQAADAYMGAVFDLQKALDPPDSSAWITLPAIADDIDLRASVLLRAGADLEQTFWKFMGFPAAWFPGVDTGLFPLLHVAEVLKNLGGKLRALAATVEDRATDYQRRLDQLQASLETVQKNTELLAARYHLKIPKSL